MKVRGRMAQQTVTLAALSEDPGSIPSTHNKTHNSSPRGSDTFFWPLRALHAHDAYTHVGKTPIHTKYKINEREGERQMGAGMGRKGERPNAKWLERI